MSEPELPVAVLELGKVPRAVVEDLSKLIVGWAGPHLFVVATGSDPVREVVASGRVDLTGDNGAFFYEVREVLGPYYADAYYSYPRL